MKKVISAQVIRDAYKLDQKQITAPGSKFIITPEARTVAKDLGVTIIEADSQEISGNEAHIDESVIKRIIHKIYERLPEAKDRPDEVKNAVIDILSGYIR